MKPVIIYTFAALYLNYLTNLINFRKELNFPDYFHTNTYFYHIHSIVRFTLFSIFFIRLDQAFLYYLKRILPVFFFLFVIANFNFFEHIINYHRVGNLVKSKLSNNLLAVEAILLLIYCLQYYLFRMQEDHDEIKKPPDFWVVTGLCIFIVPCIPIYLFYDKLLEQYNEFSRYIWKVPDLCYLIFCIMIAKAFASSKHGS